MTTRLQTLLSCAFYAATLLAVPAFPAGISLAVSPAITSVTVGGTTTVDLTIDGLGALSAPSLSAFDLDLTFNPSLALVSNTLFGSSSAPFDQLNIGDAGSITQANQPSPGHLNLIEVSLAPASVLDSQQEASFTLAEISFRGLQPGTTPLSISVNTLGDSQGNFISASSLIGGTLLVTNPTTTPEPASLTLLSSGLFLTSLLILWQRRVKA